MISKRRVDEFIYELKPNNFISLKQKKYLCGNGKFPPPRCSGDTEMTSSIMSPTVSGYLAYHSPHSLFSLARYLQHVAYSFRLRRVLFFQSLFSFAKYFEAESTVSRKWRSKILAEVMNLGDLNHDHRLSNTLYRRDTSFIRMWSPYLNMRCKLLVDDFAKNQGFDAELI